MAVLHTTDKSCVNIRSFQHEASLQTQSRKASLEQADFYDITLSINDGSENDATETFSENAK